MGLEGRGSSPSCLALGTNRPRRGQPRLGGAPPPAFPCFVFRALITVLSSELPNEAVWISCCSGFPRPLKGQHHSRSVPGGTPSALVRVSKKGLSPGLA